MDAADGGVHGHHAGNDCLLLQTEANESRLHLGARLHHGGVRRVAGVANQLLSALFFSL